MDLLEAAQTWNLLVKRQRRLARRREETRLAWELSHVRHQYTSSDVSIGEKTRLYDEKDSSLLTMAPLVGVSRALAARKTGWKRLAGGYLRPKEEKSYRSLPIFLRELYEPWKIDPKRNSAFEMCHFVVSFRYLWVVQNGIRRRGNLNADKLNGLCSMRSPAFKSSTYSY